MSIFREQLLNVQLRMLLYSPDCCIALLLQQP
jgi:hypothetical protein